jgi:hypothetical protein
MDSIILQAQDPWEWWSDVTAPEGLGGIGKRGIYGPTRTQVHQLLRLGLRSSDIAREVGVTRQYVHQLRQQMELVREEKHG